MECRANAARSADRKTAQICGADIRRCAIGQNSPWSAPPLVLGWLRSPFPVRAARLACLDSFAWRSGLSGPRFRRVRSPSGTGRLLQSGGSRLPATPHVIPLLCTCELRWQMADILDVTGERYGRLIAIKRVASKPGATMWLFRCECGVEKEIPLRSVRQGKTRACGCLGKERRVEAQTTHGCASKHQKTGALRSYTAAKRRCDYPKNNRYELYGGRGIEMCEEWRNDFAAFLRDMGERPQGMSLDRIDTNGNYEPGNCRWVTPHNQALNRRPKATKYGRDAQGVPLRKSTDSSKRRISSPLSS
jgi:hypothetical protein